MKFGKWFGFIDEGRCEERVRAQYQQLPDSALNQVDPAVLTPLGLQVYREEVARRKAARSARGALPAGD